MLNLKSPYDFKIIPANQAIQREDKRENLISTFHEVSVRTFEPQEEFKTCNKFYTTGQLCDNKSSLD
jgi:hypothetical protein